ncbi:hypothetical protein ACS0TY_020318 [Phlomoides rotata]
MVRQIEKFLLHLMLRIRENKAILENVQKTMEGIQKSITDLPSFVEGRIISGREEISVLTELMDSKIEGILDDLRVVKP